MSDKPIEPTEPEETGSDSSLDDDWAAAVAEQKAAEGSADGPAEDDWAAAVAEQKAAEKAGAGEETPFAPAARVESAQGIFPALSSGPSPSHHNGELDMLLDIPVKLTVELGRTKIPIRSILQLAQGSVIELDELAGEPMDVLVNGCLIAQGEVVVVNEKFGVRLTDIITPSERLKRLR
ncbi:MAG: flagellar motor switch protein FliN [Burkholderiaceae bacterium]